MNLREEIDGCIDWESWLDGQALPEECKVALEALILREKKASVEEYIGRLIHLEPEIGNKESSDDARLYCRLVTAQMDMFERPMSLTESNLTTFPS